MVRPNGENAAECLINYGKATREKIEQKRSELMYLEQNECKFRPMITRKSEKIINEKYCGQ